MLTNLSTIRWIFFDVGYTLFDETPAWQAAFEAVSAELARRGRAVSVDQIWAEYDDLCANYAPQQWRGLCERLGRSAEEIDALMPLAVAGGETSQEIVYPDAAGVLQRLHGRFKLGVIANQSAGTVQRLADRKLGHYFELVIGSAEAGVKKPDLAIFRMALDQAGCRAEQAVMVGDRIDNDIRPANLLGMQTIHVRQGGSGRQRPRSAEETAIVTVDTIAEVAALFESPI